MQGEHFCLEYCVEGLESICGVPRFHLVPPFRQSRTNFTFDFATVGINVRPDYCESVQRCQIQVLHTLELELGSVRRMRQFAEFHGALELPVGTYVSKVFRALPCITRLLPSHLCLEGAASRGSDYSTSTQTLPTRRVIKAETRGLRDP
ncbi:hypothetical protein EVAR_86925_1 [Eumeta japonica]|uniref:Uncharacterized protein n=1 Tax=Eumeta variegata TaxID=151549 RepID=A0A4C1W6M9_EUMVA|nr:hypothetical protein EVAR_86925_1 [Eumeta japonica]